MQLILEVGSHGLRPPHLQEGNRLLHCGPHTHFKELTTGRGHAQQQLHAGRAYVDGTGPFSQMISASVDAWVSAKAQASCLDTHGSRLGRSPPESAGEGPAAANATTSTDNSLESASRETT